jgi:hypothetical protein
VYYLIGDDGCQYGPVDEQTVLGWIAESRTNANSLLRHGDSGDWRKASDFAEFAAALATQTEITPLQPDLAGTGAGGIPQWTRPARTNGFAIWGFVVSLLGVLSCPCGIASLAGLMLSVAGIIRIKNQPEQRGKGLALAGCVISFLTLLLFVAFWVYVSQSDSVSTYDD